MFHATTLSRNPRLQRKCACGGVAGPDGECEACRRKRESSGLSRKAAHATAAGSLTRDVSPVVKSTLSSPGCPLDRDTRAALEPRFGFDFSQVRVHTDATAAQSAREVNALAYTVGRDVVFGAGHYAPHSAAGRALLAHELAHVVQQGGTAFDPSAPLYLDSPDSSLEREAERATASHGNVQTSASSGLVQRSSDAPTGGKSPPENECAGWFSDRESLSKRAAELYVRTELSGKRGVVEKIECDMGAANGAFACTVHFSDGTKIRVIARPDSIVVGVPPLNTMHPPPDQPLCWYDYKCPGPNHDLVLIKRKCQSSGKSANGKSDDHRKGPNP